jgi:hypothetical protein
MLYLSISTRVVCQVVTTFSLSVRGKPELPHQAPVRWQLVSMPDTAGKFKSS